MIETTRINPLNHRSAWARKLAMGIVPLGLKVHGRIVF